MRPEISGRILRRRRLDIPLRLSLLLTTERPAEGEADALHAATVPGWQGRRWTIETWFRTLKTGTRINDRRLDSAVDLRKCRAFDAVMAINCWKVVCHEIDAHTSPRSTLRVLTNADTESEEATRHKGCRFGSPHRDLPSFCATNERDGSAIPSHLVPAEAGSGHGQVRAVCDA